VAPDVLETLALPRFPIMVVTINSDEGAIILSREIGLESVAFILIYILTWVGG